MEISKGGGGVKIWEKFPKNVVFSLTNPLRPCVNCQTFTLKADVPSRLTFCCLLTFSLWSNAAQAVLVFMASPLQETLRGGIKKLVFFTLVKWGGVSPSANTKNPYQKKLTDQIHKCTNIPCVVVGLDIYHKFMCKIVK